MDKETSDRLDDFGIELGKLRVDIGDIKDNHLKHLRDGVNILFILIGLALAESGVVIAMLALHMGQ